MRFSIIFHALRRADGSKPVVGSSRNNSSGSPASPIGDVEPALLSARQLAHERVAFLLQLDHLDDLVQRAGVRVEPRNCSIVSATVRKRLTPVSWSTIPIAFA